jgi:hypothetical protein
MKWIDLDVGSKCWIFVGTHKGKMSKGKIAAIVRLPGYSRPHYIIEIQTSIEPILKVRDGFAVSDAARKPIGFLRPSTPNREDAGT